MEQPGGRVYPLKSLSYENQTRPSHALFPPSGVLLFVAVQYNSVCCYWCFHRAVWCGSVRLYWRVHRHKSAEINELSLPISTLLFGFISRLHCQAAIRSCRLHSCRGYHRIYLRLKPCPTIRVLLAVAICDLQLSWAKLHLHYWAGNAGPKRIRRWKCAIMQLICIIMQFQVTLTENYCKRGFWKGGFRVCVYGSIEY